MPKKATNKGAPPVKKTGSTAQKKLTFDQRFQGVNKTPLIANNCEKIIKKFGLLNKVLFRYAISWNRMVPSELNIMRNYIQYYHEYYQFDQYDNEYTLLPSLDVNLLAVSNEELLYKSLDIFKHCQWPVRFGAKFTSRVKDFTYTSQIYYILGFIMLLADGNFYGRFALHKDQGTYGYITPIEYRFIPFNRFFTIKIFREKTILFNVGVQKVPVVRGGIIKRYQYKHYLQFLDILSDNIVENPKKLSDVVDKFAKTIREDVAKGDHSDQLTLQYPKLRKKNSDMFEETINPYTTMKEVFERELQKEIHYELKPFTFKPYYASLNETSTLIFDKDIKRWVSSDYLTKLQKKAFNQYQKKVNDQMIKRFLDFQSAKTLVQLLIKIPNFRVDLTEQQKDVIGQNGNVLVIGRSGTGKTTCAVLRLFAIQMLFKIRLSLFKKKFQSQLKDTRCSADDIDQNMGLHCIFLTASPVLINEIQRYYKKLTDNIKIQLQKKRKRMQQSKNKEKEEEQQQSQSMKKKKQVPEVQIKQQKYEELKKEEEQQMVQRNVDQYDNQQIEAPENLILKKSKQIEEEEEQMNDQLGGISLDQQQANDEGAFHEEQEEDLDQMKNLLEQKMKKFKSLNDLEQSDYPGFFTVKSFIMMIDASLKKPFFIRKKDQSTESQSQATWHNEKKGVMTIQNYYRNQQEQENADNILEEIEEQINYSDEEQLEHQYMRQIQLRENRQKQKLTQKLNKNNKAMSFEVDYDYFVNYFWPTVKHRHFSARNITPHLVWTQIYSTIKGGASSHLYPGLNLPEPAYIKESTNVFLTKQEKLDVYETYCQYERWKIRSGGYDIMDAVNYILNFMRGHGYEGPDLHYIMIDQVQDLPHGIIYLLTKTVRYGVFYSGDTAQTIAKGIGFRFCDLKNLFDPRRFDASFSLPKPIVKQLTVNFRSHNNILQLANSVVSSLEILFPKTIDRLNKQVSNIKGPKPMILAEGDEQLLFYVLCGDQSYKKEKLQIQQKQKESMAKKPPLQFGCDQVIIVRDQQSKDRIPSMLQHALCLTIYEAKGLEFNDVILFNFFTESKCPQKWNLLKCLKIELKEMSKDQYEKSITKHPNSKQQQQEENQKQQDEDKQLDVDCIVDRNQGDTVFIKKLVTSQKIAVKDINDFAELCSELKMLYTAITRPKNTLIIYDEEAINRKPIQKIWQRLQIVELVSKKMLQPKRKGSQQKDTEQIQIFKSIINSTDSIEWKKQGLKMYGRGYFEQAMKCFEKSKDMDLYKKAQANMIADNASKRLIEIQSERNAIKNHLAQYQKMNESEISKLKKKLKKEQALSYDQFKKAGAIFEQLKIYKQSGQCYFSGKMFQKSFDSFSKANMNKQAAESLEMLNKYRQAAEYYQKEDDYLKVIECYDMLNQWEIILKIIQKFADQMTQLEKQSLFKKYSALALQELVYEIQFENQVEGDQKPENNRIQIIKEQEDSAEEEDWDSDEDPEIAAERALRKRSEMMSQSEKSEKYSDKRKISEVDSQISSGDRKISMVESESKRKSSLIQDDKIIKESIYENIQQKIEKKESLIQSIPNNKKISDDSSFADLNQSVNSQGQVPCNTQITNDKVFQQSVYQPIQSVTTTTKVNEEQKLAQNKEQSQKKQQPKLENIENSFADIVSQDSSFADFNSQDDNNIRYPAQLEPDIESIKSMVDMEDSWIRSALSQIHAHTNTEYSIIDEQQNYNPNIRIIKTKGNIFVQDQVMKKIVGIVSIVNQSIQQFFKQFKGYQSLITIAKETSTNDIIDNRPEISEFEDVDPKFINIILDTLESFKLYKLCLFVCNRYHMPHKAGRYLVSMALKYSTNATANNAVNPSLISPSIGRKGELQKGILASIALHAIFENVSADFLKVKVAQKEGVQEQKNTLGSYFIQGLTLEGIYKKTVFMVNPQESLKILRNYSDFQIYQQIFKQKILKKQHKQKLDFLSVAPKTFSQSQFTMMKLQSILFQYNCINKADFIAQRFYREFNLTDIKMKFDPSIIPHYTPFLQALLTQSKIQECIVKNISEAYETLRKGKGQDFKIYDIVAFLIVIISKQALLEEVFDLENKEFLQIYRCLKYIRNVLYNISLSKTSFTILEAVFSAFNCKIIRPCKSMKFINDGYSMINRTSIFCNYYVEKIKKSPNQCAYFFEQDYNKIIVKTESLLKIITKKFDGLLSRFFRLKSQHKTFHYSFLQEGFMELQTYELMKVVLRQEQKIISQKKVKKDKKQKTHHATKKIKPNFSFKAQGRPELLVDLNSSEFDSDHQEVQVLQSDQATKYILPDLNPQLQYFYNVIFSLFQQKSQNTVNCVSGRLLYCAGMNDSYKQYVNHKGGYNLYDAIQFRKFKRIDLYADNILSVISDFPSNEKSIIIGQILTLLLIQYKLLQQQSKQCRIDISRDFLKFLPKLKLLETIGKNQKVQDENINIVLDINATTCIFSYVHEYCCELNKTEIAEVINQFIDIARMEQSFKNLSVQNLIIMFLINMPYEKTVYENLRFTIKTIGNQWPNTIFEDIKSAKDVEQFTKIRSKIISNQQFIKKSVILHQIKITDSSNLEKSIADSQRDYQIKQKILQARRKAVVKITAWWKDVRKRVKHEDQLEIINENRLVKSTYNIKFLPIDDRFLLRSAKIRNVLLNFYLSKIVTSSLDFHFILMTLNKIQQLRQKYIKAYSSGITEIDDIEIDYEADISNIESSIDIWRKDSKWLKDRNIDLKRKKVFEVKWMTKNNIHSKIIKKRAGLKKQKKLQLKKQMLKKH